MCLTRKRQPDWMWQLWYTCIVLQKRENVVPPLLKAALHALLAWDCALLCVIGLHMKESTISLKLFSLSTDWDPIREHHSG